MFSWLLEAVGDRFGGLRKGHEVARNGTYLGAVCDSCEAVRNEGKGKEGEKTVFGVGNLHCVGVSVFNLLLVKKF